MIYEGIFSGLTDRKYRTLKLFVVFSLLCLRSVAQPITIVLDTVDATHVVVKAGEYKDAKSHDFFFGKHYRQDWNTPVKVQILMLDTLAGGLTPYEAGGGRQSKTLKLHDTANREYTLRSIDKTFGRALPDDYDNTFIENMVNDQVTIAEPYAALTIAPLAEAAGIYHTIPIIGYVPKQPALDSFSNEFGNRLYLFEQRPDEDWSIADNFGNATNLIGTPKLLEKLQKDNDVQIDQQLFIKSRLFDMLIGDWSRHEDQWRWGYTEENGKRVYHPVPRDRDQAYTKLDGLLVGVMPAFMSAVPGESFDNNIKDVKKYNFPARHLDRRMANETTLNDWMNAATSLQKSLTDGVIRNAIQQLPPEVYAKSGEALIQTLEARRSHLQDWARDYYLFLARHVDVPGSKQKEVFEVNRLNNDETSVKVYAVNDGLQSDQPFYNRTFKTSETKDIRLYGIEGEDVYRVSGNVDDGIKVRIIGTEDADTVIDKSSVAGLRKMTELYDNRNTFLDRSSETRVHHTHDSIGLAYNYEEYEYHHKGIKAELFYNNPDRIYAGVGYGFKRHMFRKYPYGFDQSLMLRYSISQNAFSILYQGDFYQWVHNWNLQLLANYDAVRWTYFFGLGNETERLDIPKVYYQLRTNEFQGSIGLNRVFNGRHLISANAFFQAVEVIDDKGRFVRENFTDKQLYYFEHHQYAGAEIGYTYQWVNDNVLPDKGIMFYAGAKYTNNIQETNQSFTTYNSILQLYIPLVYKFSLSLRGGITTITGTPEFYQYASIGGGQNLRGFVRDRFWGQTAFYNTNELRWITDFHTYIMNGKLGLIGFVDDGRVWMPNETSDKIHVGYGGGIILAPFNKFSVSLTYGISEESKLFQLKLNKLFFKQ